MNDYQAAARFCYVIIIDINIKINADNKINYRYVMNNVVLPRALLLSLTIYC